MHLRGIKALAVGQTARRLDLSPGVSLRARLLAHALGQELSLITGSLSDDATPDAIFASTGSLHLLS
jgi:hypothetical protein